MLKLQSFCFFFVSVYLTKHSHHLLTFSSSRFHTALSYEMAYIQCQGLNHTRRIAALLFEPNFLELESLIMILMNVIL